MSFNDVHFPFERFGVLSAESGVLCSSGTILPNAFVNG